MKAVLRWKATFSLNSPHKLNADGVTFARVHRYPEGNALVEWSKEHLPSFGMRVPSGLGKRARPERHVYNIRLPYENSFASSTLVAWPRNGRRKRGGSHALRRIHIRLGLVRYHWRDLSLQYAESSEPPLAISIHSSADFDPRAWIP